jgi:hypothetical protein
MRSSASAASSSRLDEDGVLAGRRPGVDQPESRGRPKAAAGQALPSVGASTAPPGGTQNGPRRGSVARGAARGLLARGCRLSAQQLRQLGEVRRHAPGLVTPFVAERRRGLGGDL